MQKITRVDEAVEGFLGGASGKEPTCQFRRLKRDMGSTQGLNLHLLHCRQILYHLSHQGSPYLEEVSKWLDSLTGLSSTRILTPQDLWTWRGILGPGHTPRWGLFGPAVTRAQPPAFPRNPRGRLGFPGPIQGEGWDPRRKAWIILIDPSQGSLIPSLPVLHLLMSSQKECLICYMFYF